MNWYKNKPLKWCINIFSILSMVWPSILLGQTYFNMRYPPDLGTWGSGCYSVEVTSDSFLLSRWSLDQAQGRWRNNITVIDSGGVLCCNKDSLQLMDQNIFIQAFTKSKSGFCQAVSIENYNPKSSQYGVLKYDEFGQRISTVIDTTLYPYIYILDLAILDKNQLMLVGVVNNSVLAPNNQDLLLIKTDSSGHQIWKKTYNMGNYAWRGESISLCDDGGFIIGGAEIDYSSHLHPDYFTRPIVMKVDSNGNRIWHRKLGSTTYDNKPAYGVTQTPDGFAFVGAVGVPYWDGSNDNAYAPWVVGLNPNGGVIWMDTLNPEKATGSSVNYLSDIELIQDSNLIISGQHKIWNDSNTGTDKWRIHGVITKYSMTGEQKWLRTYRHPEVIDTPLSDHYLFDIDPTPDGGFVAAGYLLHSTGNTQDTWMIKVDSFGCLVKGCEVTSVPKIESSIASLKIYPNPANEVIHFDITPTLRSHFGSLRLRSVQDAQRPGLAYELTLYDMLGRLVLTQTLYPNENTINVASLKPGVYNYRLGETWGSILVE